MKTDQNESKWAICPRCDGEGFVSKLGAFTASDVDDWFGDDWYERDSFASEYTKRGGAYDEACPVCKGERVVDRKAMEKALYGDGDDADYEYSYRSEYAPQW